MAAYNLLVYSHVTQVLLFIRMEVLLDSLHAISCQRFYKMLHMIKFIALHTFVYVLNVKSCSAHVDGAKLEEECKIADICRHDQVPICGIDSCGEMRTFIDTCDMHEFNCDSRKDFTQKPAHECWVTCKRGRSFKKAEYGADCDRQNMV